MTPTPFSVAVGIEPLGDGRYAAQLGTDWTVGPKAHGGLLMVLMVRAALARLAEAGAGGAPDPLAVAADYLHAPDPGPIELRTELLRVGRSTAVAAVRLLQDGRAMLAGTVTAGRLPGGEPRHAALPKLPAEPVDGAIDPVGLPGASNLSRCCELRWDPASTGFVRGEPGPPEVRGWVRPRGEPTDLLFALLAGDILPPTVFNLGGAPGWAPTVQLTALLRTRPAPGWLRLASHATAVHGGWFDEDALVLDSAGRLICQARQLALAPRLPSPP